MVYMVKNTSINLDVTVNSSGYKISGGTTTPLALTVAGAGSLVLQSSFAGTSTLMLPNSPSGEILTSAVFRPFS